jgi:hypothetical protein
LITNKKPDQEEIQKDIQEPLSPDETAQGT